MKSFTVLNFFLLTALFTGGFYIREAATSQVMYVNSGMTLESLTQGVQNVVIVKPSDKWEVYREEVLHVDTPPGAKPIPDDMYKEHVQIFEVVTVLKSETIKPGQIIKSWVRPVYDYETQKKMHETGMSITMASQRYESSYPPTAGENIILFVADKEPEKSVYIFAGQEGILAQKEVEDFLKKDSDGVVIVPHDEGNP